MLSYRPALKPLARQLRSAMTDAEQALWQRLRRKQLGGVQFYRQRPLGCWIVDFCAPAARLVIEVDGSQHLTPEGRAADRRRDAALERLGFRVLRFDDRQVLTEMDAVLEVILAALSGAVESPPTPLVPRGEDEHLGQVPPLEKGGSGGFGGREIRAPHPAPTGRETR